MKILRIQDVAIFDHNTVEGPSKITFEASPGEIIENESEQCDSVIDGTGCTLIPGLIDSKIDADCEMSSLPQFASFGVTTVVDSSSGTAETQAMRAASSQSSSLPTYLATGSPAGPAGKTASKCLPYRAVTHIATVAEAEDFVAERATRPYYEDIIKVIADLPGLEDRILKTTATAAHRQGKLAMAHASQTKAYRRAIDANFDILTPVPFDGLLDTETVKEMAEKRVAVIPTLCFIQHILQQEGFSLSDFSYALANVKSLYEAGVRICAGTAANKEGPLKMAFGRSLHEELVLLGKAGMPNADVLRAATSVPSQVFRLHDRGVLGPGHRADLVLVEGNPLEDIQATGRIRRVWVKGVEIAIKDQSPTRIKDDA
ncbi:hypothetical protein G7046_g4820 [Stylonectria norvegica]|nr:hypothetical protein G7046_g4820 [Stylonectria norvegica]